MESKDIFFKILLPLLIFAPSLPSIISLIAFGYKLGHGEEAFRVKVAKTLTVKEIEEIDAKYDKEKVGKLIKGNRLFEEKALLVSRINEKNYC